MEFGSDWIRAEVKKFDKVYENILMEMKIYKYLTDIKKPYLTSEEEKEAKYQEWCERLEASLDASMDAAEAEYERMREAELEEQYEIDELGEWGDEGNDN